MKKIFALAVLFAALTMVSCGCKNKKADNAEKAATECCAECCAEKAECKEACCAEQCAEKKECCGTEKCADCPDKKECCKDECPKAKAEPCCAECEK